jgi:hypothetical protein
MRMGNGHDSCDSLNLPSAPPGSYLANSPVMGTAILVQQSAKFFKANLPRKSKHWLTFSDMAALIPGSYI